MVPAMNWIVRTLSALSITGAALSSLAGCGEHASSGSYLVTVVDRSTGRALDGASVEMIPVSGQKVTGTTDQEGEIVLVLGAWPRAELRVGFDGESDRYFVRTTKIPNWDAPVGETGSTTTPDGTTGPLLFMAGGGGGSQPRFDVRLVRLKKL